MFQPFDLVIEANKLKQRFESNGFKIITDIMEEFEKPEIKVIFAQLLNDVNVIVKDLDNIFKDVLPAADVILGQINLIIEEKVLNQLFTIMNVIMFEMGYNFIEIYDKYYWDRMYDFVKQLWTAMPEDSPVPGANKGFKHLFEDFHDEVVTKYPSLFVKKLCDVGSMYRCRSWCVNDDYELMIPNEKYVKNNRWNPDGVAFLYLACGDDNISHDAVVNVVQKTCFEEIRLNDGSEVAICQFKPVKKDAKIIDMCYEGVDLSKLAREFEDPPQEYLPVILDAIFQNPELTRKMKRLTQNQTKDDFIKKAGPELNRLMTDTGIIEKIKEVVYSRASIILLGLIDKSIFEAVDIEDDPELKAYMPFRAFSQYLMEKGYDGIIYRSTRMNKIGLTGKNLVLFEKSHAKYEPGTMKKYRYNSGQYIEFI